MNFWKEHGMLRAVLMAFFFLTGLGLTYFGWKMTGQMQGLLLMIVGLVFLLSSLFLYNASFRTPKNRKK
ncbi:MAG: hypothetical protein SOW48_05070 [Peptoniphilaceae bacterium]|nr:hypothetical protein [Peptoniphilaceae bacterium]MCI6660413.1 hypothetical protein [Peptoniphilaceae bacterium]MDD7433348.1 hypothetical protein [Peptoniphilaceae bacterium]MDY3075999.1 hypothetical protein [Peptoniphilaceae bacterium]MDY3987610.1 hypothetical protein [Peptoniphilaceae bacterium]